MESQDIESLKRMFTSVVTEIKEVDSELIAYQMALVAMKESQPEAAEAFERFKVVARVLPSYQTKIQDTYDLPLAQLLDKISHVQTLTEAVEEWLRVQKEHKAVN